MQKYIRYQIENTEPIRIADDSVSQLGQVATLRYIPGSTVRGYIVNSLAKEPDFQKIKTKLFSACFKNKVFWLTMFHEAKKAQSIPGQFLTFF